MELFYEVFEGMPRQGPGSSECTAKAWRMLTGLPDRPMILDAGCGSGASTVELAKLSRGTVVGVDSHQPFLDRLRADAEAAGIGERIHVFCGDMGAPDFPENHFDVIWSEGAIYNIGFEAGLGMWKRFIRPGGYVAVTEATWLKDHPPKAIYDYWMAEYPAITHVAQNIEMIERCGYEFIGGFTLPETTWRNNYYEPMARRIEQMREQYPNRADAKEVFAMLEEEIAMYGAYSTYYSYTFFVMRHPE